MSAIEWTDKTWNPVTGCTKVSEGCRHCYAEVMAKRTFGRLYPPVYDKHPDTKSDADPLRLTEVLGRPRRFTDVQCHHDRLDTPLRWRKPCRVFVNSMSDLFHPDVPDEFIDQVFAVMALTPQHTYQVLTKRPERMRAYLRGAENDLQRWGSAVVHVTGSPCASHIEDQHYPLHNVWLGVSVEDQKTANERIPLLLQTPAAVRFVSYEPALGPVDFGVSHGLPVFRFADKPIESYDGLTGRLIGVHPELAGTWGRHDGSGPWLDWVIVGGESGPKARLCNVAWVRSVVEQCRAAGVSVFVKQLGANAQDEDGTMHGRYSAGGIKHDFPKLTHPKGGDISEFPKDLRVREFPR